LATTRSSAVMRAVMTRSTGNVSVVIIRDARPDLGPDSTQVASTVMSFMPRVSRRYGRSADRPCTTRP
jgi:hypothetical protein